MAKDLRYYLKFDSNGRKIMRELGVDAKQLDAALAKVGDSSKKARQSMMSTASAVVVMDGLASATNTLYTATKALSDAYAVQVEAETKLATVMRERMHATDEQIQSVKDLASAQQELGVIGDEVQLAGAQQLATFLTTTDTLKTLVPAMNNLVAQQKGLSATGTDAVSVANLMGKAMMGQVSALTRVGIVFSDVQEQILKYGTESMKAATLATVIRQNVGDMNAELAKTDAGKLKQLENALGDVKEKAGGVVQGMMPAITAANQTMMLATNAQRMYVGVADLIKILRQLHLVESVCAKARTANVVSMRVFSQALTAMGISARSAQIAVRGLSAAVRGLMIASVVGAAIAAVTYAIEKLIEHFDSATESTKKFVTAQDLAVESSERQKSLEQTVTQTRNEALASIETYISKIEALNGNKSAEKKLVDELNQKYGSTMGYYNDVSSWLKTLKDNVGDYCDMLVLQIQLQELAAKKADLLNRKRNIKYNADGSEKTYSKKNKTSFAKLVTSSIAYASSPEASHVVSPSGEIENSSDWHQANETLSAINAELADTDRLMKDIAAQLSKNKLASNNFTQSPTNGTIKVDISGSPMEYKSEAQFEAKIKELTEARSKAVGKAQRDAIDAELEHVEDIFRIFKTRPDKIAKKPTLKDIGLDTKFETPEPQLDMGAWDEWADGVSKRFHRVQEEGQDTISNLTRAWGNAKGVVSGVEGLTEVLTSHGNAWDKISAAVDGAIQLYQNLSGVIEVVTTITDSLNAAKKVESAVTNISTASESTNMAVKGASGAVKVANTAKTKSDTNANIANAASGAMAAHSEIPFVGIALGVAAIAAMIAAMVALPKFAKGGIAYGPTLGMFGEYPGAANNPEVVAPLNKLRQLIQPQQVGPAKIELRLRGRDLVGAYDGTKNYNSRS